MCSLRISICAMFLVGDLLALSYGQGSSQPDTEATSAACGVKWALDLTKVSIPNIEAQGVIHGRKFTCEKAELQGDILTLSQGKDFFPDLALTIFLFGRGENEMCAIAPDTEVSMRPHIHMKWKPAEASVPETEIFMEGYAMRLELGTKSNGKLPGKIYICLPDEHKSVVAGKFEAVIK